MSPRRSSRAEDRLREEIEQHIELATEAYIRRGLAPDDARRAARIAFGPMEHFKDEARDQFRSPRIAALRQDLRYAFRLARRTPLLTAVAVVTLSVGIALATAAFTVVNGVLFRGLPYPAPERLALVWGTKPGAADRDPVSFTNAMDWRRDVTAFESLAAFSCAPRPIVGAGPSAARASSMLVSADFFPIVGATPLLGRLFEPADFSATTDENGLAIVVTDALWRDRFAADPAIVGKHVLLDGEPVSVVGVLRPEYTPLPASLACRPDIYRPLAARYDDAQRTWSFLRVVARLAPSASVVQAQAQLDAVNARLARTHPSTNRGSAARVVLLRDWFAAPLRPVLTFVQLGALLVLIVACANVTSLLLARAVVRRRELSIRIAMGASRARIVRQIATECVLLGGTAAVLGVLVSVSVTGFLTSLGGGALPDPRGLAVDWRVIGFAALASIVATAAFGMVAVAKSQGDGAWLIASLRDGARGSAAARSPVGRAIVAAQLAIGMIVLLSAGLLIRSYQRVRDVDPGFDPSSVTTARIVLPSATYSRGPQQIIFFRQVLARIAAQPGVAAAGAVSVLPESPNFDHTRAKVVGRAYAPNEEPMPDVYRVTPGYFSAMHIPLRAGRAFTDDDDDRHPLVAVLNETMATALFPGGSAIGRRIWTGAGDAERTIVGVVGDAYQYGLDGAKTMQLYVPHADNAGGDLTLVVRSGTGSPPSARVLRDAVRAIDPGIPIDDVMTMQQVVAASASRRRLLARLALVFAIGAVGLAVVGLYGLLAYSVSQRTCEIGVRMAVGATRSSIVRFIVSDAMGLALAGIVLGLGSAVMLNRVIAPLLFGISVADAATLVGAPIVLIAAVIVACAVPAFRAASVNPATALRGD